MRIGSLLYRTVIFPFDQQLFQLSGEGIRQQQIENPSFAQLMQIVFFCAATDMIQTHYHAVGQIAEELSADSRAKNGSIAHFYQVVKMLQPVKGALAILFRVDRAHDTAGRLYIEVANMVNGREACSLHDNLGCQTEIFMIRTSGIFESMFLPVCSAVGIEAGWLEKLLVIHQTVKCFLTGNILHDRSGNDFSTHTVCGYKLRRKSDHICCTSLSGCIQGV